MRRGHHGCGRAVPAAVEDAAVLVGLADLAVGLTKAAEASADLYVRVVQYARAFKDSCGKALLIYVYVYVHIL